MDPQKKRKNRTAVAYTMIDIAAYLYQEGMRGEAIEQRRHEIWSSPMSIGNA